MDFLKEIEDVFDKLSGRQLTAFYTQKIDNFLIEIFNSIESKTPLALIAVGGYGRAELAPFSDIDIMFFAKNKSDAKKVESVLYKLWDAGLTIGHSFRTAEDCLLEAKKDLRTHTSLLEARFLAGDNGLYNYFLEKVYAEIAYKKQRNFITGKLKEMGKRHRDYGGSVFLLEPNVKEGQGCLRDIHTILWLARAAFKLKDIEELLNVISKSDFKRLVKAYDFLLKVRFCLHLTGRRRNDVLSFNTHDYAAQRLGFHDSKKFLSSERFMRYFYLKASVVKDITLSIAEICGRQRSVSSGVDGLRKKKVTDSFYICKNVIASSEDNLFRKRPDKIIEAFYVFSKTGKNFSHRMRDDIRHSLILVGKQIRNLHKAMFFFMEILKGKRVYETLKEMNDTGVLGRFIPEFGALRSLVVYEPYHRYTVDEHTLRAVKNLERLTATKYKNLEHLSEIMQGIKERETLFIALLFHDIGKASGKPRALGIAQGKYHEEEGYRRLKNIVERFNINIESRQRIEFLVKSHILMSSLALKREIEDPEIVAQFADAAGDEENLRALYLVTYADMSAVNPVFWTEWKAYLLRELYERTLKYLKGVREDTETYISNILSLYTESEREGLRDFLSKMPERYLISTPPERIYEDYKLVYIVGESDPVIAINERHDSTTEIIIGTWDRPGLFSRIVGFLSSKWLNIVSARLYTGKEGLVIDKIKISNWKELWWDGMEDAVKNGLKAVILEGASINLEYIKRDVSMRFDLFIELDNETSEDSTIIEFFSQDRHGLLYDISKLFYKNKLNIISAKINTELGIAQDIFYIQHEGGKVKGPMIIEMLGSLWEALKN